MHDPHTARMVAAVERAAEVLRVNETRGPLPKADDANCLPGG